jgi:dynein heavy chain
MFDGPVDAIWIENMNTVLDDNKKLCLNSGQIITLTAQMTMMFEVDDLSYASPATVSRCGMVYMEPGALGNEPLVKSWMNTLPASFKLRKQLIPTIKGFFDQYLHDMIKYARKYCPEPDVTCDNNLTESCFRILNCYFADYIESDIKKVTADDIEDLEASIEQLFIFALIWSIGGSCGLEGREKFDKKLRPLLSSKCGIPDEGKVYDYVWLMNKKEWVKWTEIVDDYFVDNKMAYGEIVVPTFDSIRM